MISIGWFATGRGPGSRGLFNFIYHAIEDGQLDAQIEFVFSNREWGEANGSDEFIRLVKSYGFQPVTFSSERYRQERGGGPMRQHRADFDREVMDLLGSKDYRPDICVLAGYMLICSSSMCRHYPLLNLHGALPNGPTGTWQSVIWNLIESRSTHTGSMIHLATEAVDRGPALSHCELPITGGQFDADWERVWGRDISEIRATEGENNPLFQRIRAEGYRREPYLLLETLKAVAARRLVVEPCTAWDADGNPLSKDYPMGLPLGNEIEMAIGSSNRHSGASRNLWPPVSLS